MADRGGPAPQTREGPNRFRGGTGALVQFTIPVGGGRRLVLPRMPLPRHHTFSRRGRRACPVHHPVTNKKLFTSILDPMIPETIPIEPRSFEYPPLLSLLTHRVKNCFQKSSSLNIFMDRSRTTRMAHGWSSS
jgi:hypothetical protein